MTDEQRQQIVEQKQRLCQMLTALHEEVSSNLFEVVAEGPLELLHQLQEQVENL